MQPLSSCSRRLCLYCKKLVLWSVWGIQKSHKWRPERLLSSYFMSKCETVRKVSYMSVASQGMSCVWWKGILKLKGRCNCMSFFFLFIIFVRYNFSIIKVQFISWTKRERSSKPKEPQAIYTYTLTLQGPKKRYFTWWEKTRAYFEEASKRPESISGGSAIKVHYTHTF